MENGEKYYIKEDVFMKSITTKLKSKEIVEFGRMIRKRRRELGMTEE